MLLKFLLESGTRLDIGIHNAHPELFSRAMAQKLIQDGLVQVDNVLIKKSSFKAFKESEVKINFEPPPLFDLTPNDDFKVPILYQDDYLAIIHKPPAMTVHPGAGTGNDTLVHVLISQIKNLSEGSDETRPGIVHRLDRDTEGLMVIAKNNQIHYELARLFYDRKIEKEYYAIVWGAIPEKGSINGFIGRHPVNRKKMLFDFIKLNRTYKEASLDYERIQNNQWFSLLRIFLYTGRTHQIRASFSKIDHPVVGDELYSRFIRRMDKTTLSSEIKNNIISGGLYLLAQRLSFTHPVTLEKMEFTLPLPQRFKDIFSI